LRRQNHVFPVRTAFLVVFLVLTAAGPLWADTPWLKLAPGYAGLAMDDFNNEQFSFFEDSAGYDMKPLNGGFALSFHLGYDLAPAFAMGFSWDRQFARTTGTDQDVEAKVNADADLLMGHGTWTPVRGDGWSLGGVLGFGPIFTAGSVKEVKQTVSFGEAKLRGNGWAFEVLVMGDWRLSTRSLVELTAGWRQAKVSKIEADKRPVFKADGDRLALDYSGFVVKLGWKYEFGGENNESRPEIN
jgi:hypothetical protein